MNRDTSLAAHDAIQSKLSNRQRVVMLAMHDLGKPVTRKFLAKHLDWPINALVPRVLECIDKGYLEECGTAIEDGRKAHLVRVRPAQLSLLEAA